MALSQGGWSLVQSIAAELDAILGVTSGTQEALRIDLPFLESIPADWQAQWPDLLGRPRPWPGVLGILSLLAGVEFEPDYSKATLAMRSLTLAEAIRRAAAHDQAFGLAPDPALAPAEQLADLMARGAEAVEAAFGLQRSRPGESSRVTAYEVGRVVLILRDGELHDRFWHWLDRAYYEWYRPWRESQAALLAAEEQRAIAGLGSREGEGAPPTAWLAPQHPLHTSPELQRVVQERRAQIYFWIQPFGLFDSWALGKGMVMLSFAEPGDAYSSFRERGVDLARRMSALSDPTRLLILRMIRNYAKDNTQMAEFLGVARPAVSTHAKILREAGLIETAQEGRGARHTINYGALRQLFAEIERFLDMPDEI